MADLRITDVRLTPAGASDEEAGLLGYVGFTINGVLALDGVTLRRAAGGRLYISYPARTARTGTRHPLVRPLGEAARLHVEAQVLAALDFSGGDGK